MAPPKSSYKLGFVGIMMLWCLIFIITTLFVTNVTAQQQITSQLTTLSPAVLSLKINPGSTNISSMTFWPAVWGNTTPGSSQQLGTPKSFGCVGTTQAGSAPVSVRLSTSTTNHQFFPISYTILPVTSSFIDVTCTITLTDVNFSNFAIYITPTATIVGLSSGTVLTYTPPSGQFALPSLDVKQATSSSPTNDLILRTTFPCVASTIRTDQCQNYIDAFTTIRYVDDGASLFDANTMQCQRFVITTNNYAGT
eukprot:UN06464